MKKLLFILLLCATSLAHAQTPKPQPSATASADSLDYYAADHYKKANNMAEALLWTGAGGTGAVIVFAKQAINQAATLRGGLIVVGAVAFIEYCVMRSHYYKFAKLQKRAAEKRLST